MAQRRAPISGSRDEAMQNDAFRTVFEAEQRRLEACHVGTIRIDNALERYLFEIYAAMTLGTGEWNTFDTH